MDSTQSEMDDEHEAITDSTQSEHRFYEDMEGELNDMIVVLSAWSFEDIDQKYTVEASSDVKEFKSKLWELHADVEKQKDGAERDRLVSMFETLLVKYNELNDFFKQLRPSPKRSSKKKKVEISDSQSGAPSPDLSLPNETVTVLN